MHQILFAKIAATISMGSFAMPVVKRIMMNMIKRLGMWQKKQYILSHILMALYPYRSRLFSGGRVYTPLNIVMVSGKNTLSRSLFSWYALFYTCCFPYSK